MFGLVGCLVWQFFVDRFALLVTAHILAHFFFATFSVCCFSLYLCVITICICVML